MLGNSDKQGRVRKSIQDIKQAVGEAPQEEEDGDQTDGDDRLFQSDLGSSGNFLIADALAFFRQLLDFHHGWPAIHLCFDFFGRRLRLHAHDAA